METLRTTLEEAGHTLQSAEVIYKKILPWGSAKARLFLVRYLRGDGYASVGCVGPFVRMLDDLPMADIDLVPAKTVNRRLIELYIGQFFIDRAHSTASRGRGLLSAADLEAAFADRTTDLSIARRLATAGAENMQSTWVMGLPAQFCTVRCHAEPTGIWLEDMLHLIAPITITFDISRGGTSKYTGRVEVSQPHYVRSRDGQTIDHLGPVSDIQVSFPAHRLANVIGSIYGPGEILDKWGWAHFADR